MVHLRKAWAGWGKPTVVARRPLFWYIGCGLLHTVHGILGHFDKKAFCRTLLCANHEILPLIPMFFTKSVMQNALVWKPWIQTPYSYFFHKDRSAERFLCKHAIQTPFFLLFNTDRSAERFLCKHAIQTPFSYFWPKDGGKGGGGMSCNTDRWWLWPQNDTPPSVMVVMAAIGGTWEMGLGMVGQVFTTGFKMPYCRQPGDTKRRGFQKIHSADRILGGNHRNRVHFGEMCVFSCLDDHRHSPSPPLWKLTLAAGLVYQWKRIWLVATDTAEIGLAKGTPQGNKNQVFKKKRSAERYF